MKPQNRVGLPTALSFIAMLVAIALTGRGADSGSAAGVGDTPGAGASSNGAISPQDQADALHFVIAADREIYCREFLAQQKGDNSPPNPALGVKPDGSWPSPSEMLRRAAESIQENGAEFSYALRSLHPSDPRDGPQTELEQRGLAFVTSHPAQNYYGQEMLGGRRYFTAVYPDTLPAGGAMSAIVVRVPLEF
jgi:hypothetical protein